MGIAKTVMDGNEAVAHVAYQASEVITIYPITPSSAMAECCDQWACEGKKNAWGTVPHVVEMQSEGGAAGALHGSLQAGSPTTTFTASQGLLLMIPNMYKIAGELTPLVIHVAARALAAQGLSIFGDHSDVMAARSTGFAMLSSASVQEAADMALIAHAATLESRLPFMHFFDGFRTSHEESRINLPNPQQIASVLKPALIQAHRQRALSPDHPVLRGTAQNPDVYFQGRETVNPFYLACPDIVQNAMDELAALTKRRYQLFDYVGPIDAEHIIVLMGSAAGTVEEVIGDLQSRGEKVGLIKVRLYRPFSARHFLALLPASVKTVTVLDRCKEPGSLGEPLYLDVVAACNEADAPRPRILAGRYGLASKEFTPGMVKAVFDNAKAAKPRHHFTIGIQDDITHASLHFEPDYFTEAPETVRAIFYGLGSDGTVGANKNAIKIVGENTELNVQGYFVYDSKKSGSVTVSHLRFGPHAIRSAYLIRRANFVACHHFSFLERLDILSQAEPGGTFLLNTMYSAEEVWQNLPHRVQAQVINKHLRFFTIDAQKVARQAGLGGRINTVMQVCFFALSAVLPRERAVAAIKEAISKTYGKRGHVVVDRNNAAVDAALSNLVEVAVPSNLANGRPTPATVSESAPDFVKKVTSLMMIGQGDALPVSAIPADGTWPVGTARWEKRNIAVEVPVWDEKICIQCGKCVLVCPHATIRGKLYDPELLSAAPPAFKHAAARWPDRSHLNFTLQVATEDCTGCGLCVAACPVKNKSESCLKAINMRPQAPLREQESKNWDFFLGLPEMDRGNLRSDSIKDVQIFEPLFEFSGACAGCGETPYLKLLSQLFGDRALIANATGCSSIYGGNLPTTPWSTNRAGRGPAWSNSLFEDNAEFGFGMRLALDKQAEYARELVERMRSSLGEVLADQLLYAEQKTEPQIEEQRHRVQLLKQAVAGLGTVEARDLLAVADTLVRKSVWIVGGDGWAYDIGYGGLDHVLAAGRNVKILVLDTEVYSNTGGQMSKATSRGAVAKFAASGKTAGKKDLALLAMSYGNVYVARVAMGGSDVQTLTAFQEAEAYDGPALIIAYSHCIAHGYDMIHGLEQQKAAVLSGYWPLLRFHPNGKPMLHLDSKPPSLPLEKYLYNEGRFAMLRQSNPAKGKELLRLAQDDVRTRWELYEHLARKYAAAPAMEKA